MSGGRTPHVTMKPPRMGHPASGAGEVRPILAGDAVSAKGEKRGFSAALKNDTRKDPGLKAPLVVRFSAA